MIGLIGLMFIRYKIELLRKFVVWEKIKKESEKKTFRKELSSKAKLVIGIYIASILLFIIGFFVFFCQQLKRIERLLEKFCGVWPY